MKKLTLDEIKQIELQMLVVWDEFCKKNKLKYFLSGGTLLGAVRHQGFIPWDDDIDVFMPRDDYEKMQEILIQERLTDDIELQSLKKGNSVYPFAKLIHLKTRIKEKYVELGEYQHIWIDIFPIDTLPDSEKICKKIYKKMDLYQLFLGVSYAKFGEGKTLVRKILKMLIYPIAHLFGSEYFANKKENLAKKYEKENTGYAGVMVWGYGIKERMPTRVFASSVDVVFEGYKFPAPVGYKRYLKSLYGDYMKLPDEKKRTGHEFDAEWIEK